MYSLTKKLFHKRFIIGFKTNMQRYSDHLRILDNTVSGVVGVPFCLQSQNKSVSTKVQELLHNLRWTSKCILAAMCCSPYRPLICEQKFYSSFSAWSICAGVINSIRKWRLPNTNMTMFDSVWIFFWEFAPAKLSCSKVWRTSSVRAEHVLGGHWNLLKKNSFIEQALKFSIKRWRSLAMLSLGTRCFAEAVICD